MSGLRLDERACLIKIYVMVHSKAKQSFWSDHNKTMIYLYPRWQKLGKTAIILAIISSLLIWYQARCHYFDLLPPHHLSYVSTLWWWHVTQYIALFKAMINLLGYIPPCITMSKLITNVGWWIGWAEIKQRSFPEIVFFFSNVIFIWMKRRYCHAAHLQTEKLPWSYRKGN